MNKNDTVKQESVRKPNISPDIGTLMKSIEEKINTGPDTAIIDTGKMLLTDTAKKENCKSTAETLYIPFLLGSIRFAVPLDDTLEVSQSMTITPLPNLPFWIRGIGNIRGEVISVVDLKVFFGSEPGTVSKDEYILVLHNGHMKTGLIVDRLMGVKALGESDSRTIDIPYPDGDIKAYIEGMIVDEKGIINVLNTRSLLGSEKMNAFR